jgi:hypothetical protein
MNCLVCGGGMEFYFSKHFDVFALKQVDYWRCSDCGFVLSKTHADMTASEWSALNEAYHSSYQGQDFNADDPRWIARLQSQAKVLRDAVEIGLLSADGRWLDYACGDGRLSELLQEEHLELLKYDRYMSRAGGYLDERDLRHGSFDFVITTSVFEHLMRRAHFDAIEALVAPSGVLGLHTLVSETVPRDPAWFYLLPVHCAFHTNKSMSVLLEQWGYACSVYNVDSRLWLCFKEPPPDIRERIEAANRRPDGPPYLLKDGFVDYWK